MIRLYITPDGQQPYLLSFERASVSVGSAVDSDVRLRAPGVSSRHFRLRRVGGDVLVDDLGSSNGTYVNELKVIGSQVLSVSDEIYIAGFSIRVLGDGTAPVATPNAAGTAAKPRLAGTAAKPKLAETAAKPKLAGAVPAAAVVATPAVHVEELRAPAVEEVDPPAGFDAPRVAGLVEPLARAWEERADPHHLLAGEELREARIWVDCGTRVQPAAGRRERALVDHSRHVAQRRIWSRLGAFAVLCLAFGGGGWMAGRVLAEGPGGAKNFMRVAVQEGSALDVERKRQVCAARAQELAGSALVEAKTSFDAALVNAAEGLRCVVEHDLRDLPLERTVRTLLGGAHSHLVERAGARLVTAAPSGKSFAWARDDGTVVVWDFARGSATTSDGGATPTMLSASERGDRLVALDNAGQVRVWSLLDPAVVTRLVLDLPDPGAAALSGDGRVLVAARRGAAELRVFNLGGAGAVMGVPLAGVPGPIGAVVVNGDATRVFAASGTEVVAWRLVAGRKDRPVSYAGHEAVVTALTLVRCSGRPGEPWLLSGDAGGTVRMWDLRSRSGKPRPTVLTGVGGIVSAVQMTADCNQVVAAGPRGLRVWDLRSEEPDRTPRDVETGGPIAGLQLDGKHAVVAAGSKLVGCDLGEGVASCEDLAGHTGQVRGLDLASASGWVISAGEDGTARLWDVRATAGAASLQAHHGAPLRDVAVADEGRVLTASGSTAVLWRLSGLLPPEQVAVLPGTEGRLMRAVALSPNPEWAATAADESSLTLWRVGGDRAPSPTSLATVGRLTHLDFSYDGAWLAGIGPQASCAIDMRGSVVPRCQPLPHTGEMTALSFLPNTHKIAVGGADREVVLVDLEELSGPGGRQTFGSGKGVVRALAVSPDGRWLAAGGENADGRLWNLGASRLSRGVPPSQALGGLTETVNALGFSSDSRWLVVAAGRKLYSWELARFSGPPTQVREGLPTTVQALAFVGDRVLSGSTDGKVLAWSVTALEQREPIEFGSHRDKVSQIAVTPDGRFAVSAGNDTTLHVWPLGLEPLRELALRVQGVAH